MLKVEYVLCHRGFPVFIWKFGFEPTRRDTLFRTARSRGVRLTLLIVSQVVSRFPFLRDQRHPCLRAVHQTKRSPYLPNFFVSCSHDELLRVFVYLKEVVSGFCFLAVCFSLDYLSVVSIKILFRDIRDTLFLEPLFRLLYTPGPGQDIRCRLKKDADSPVCEIVYL